jgi:uncharacterized protein (DUF1501 family)
LEHQRGKRRACFEKSGFVSLPIRETLTSRILHGKRRTVALLAGGAVKGGRVIADWPGLKPANLYEGRDLAPTTDLRAVIKGVLHDHLGVAERVLAETVFPDSAGVKAAQGLVG